MKATLRRNGRRMVTVRASHHLDGVDIAQVILIHRSSGYGAPDKIGDRWSRHGIERFIRDVLSAHGDSASFSDTWRDDYEGFSGISLDEAVRWAAGLVRRHFPELAGEALDAWERGELDDQ